MFIMDCGLFHCGLKTDCRHVGAIFFNGFSNSEQTCESFIYLSFTHICSESLEPFLKYMGIRFVTCVRFSEVWSDKPLCPSESVVEVLLGGIVLIYLAMEGHGK